MTYTLVSVGPSSSSRTSLSRTSGERYHRVSCRGLGVSSSGSAANISCRGRNRTRGRQSNNLPSVPTHKPYKMGTAQSGRPRFVFCLHGRPPRASPHAVTPSCRLSEIAGALAPSVPGAFFAPPSGGLEPYVLPFGRTPEIGPHQSPSASVRNRTSTGGVRNRCSTSELRTREAEKYREFAGANAWYTPSESGEIRTLTARGKSPARFLLRYGLAISGSCV